jgi:hypothetical protein
MLYLKSVQIFKLRAPYMHWEDEKRFTTNK